MSALPKQVQKQIAEANRIAEEIKTLQSGDPPPPAASNEPPAPPAPPSGDGQGAPPPATNEDPAEHKYKVLQGKYNKEVPRLQAQVREYESAVNDLRSRLTTTEALLIALGQKEGAPAKPGEEPARPAGVTEQEIKEFGPDLYDFIKRVSTGVASQETTKVSNRLGQVEQTASHAVRSVAKSARERLLSDLAGVVPNWEQMDTDPDFLQWLDEADEFSGRRRGDLLTEAYGANDSNRVIRFFTGFQRENAAATPAGGEAAQPAKKAEARQTLGDYVAPGTPKTGPAGAQNESGRRVWTRKEISDYYAQRNEYARKGKKIPEALLKEERDLDKAMKEGRVQA